MAYLIGIDEAGYGPFLGPLCIAATYWSLPDDLLSDHVELYSLLDQLVSTSLKDKSRIMIGDSKQAYKPGGGLKNLERAVFPLLANPPHSFDQWMQTYAVKWNEWSARSPWFQNYDRALPCDLEEENLLQLQQLVKRFLPDSQVDFLGAKVW